MRSVLVIDETELSRLAALGAIAFDGELEGVERPTSGDKMFAMRAAVLAILGERHELRRV